MQRNLEQFCENLKNKNFELLNERQVETSIVIPLLEGLGWDTTKEDEVLVQSNIGKGKSDIELRSNGWCKVVIDAKKGKANLVSLEFERQLMSYAGGVNNGEPSDIAILTNGKNWQFYLPSIDGGYNKKRFYNIDISEKSSKDTISIFNELLLKNNIIDGSSFNRSLLINEQRLKSEVTKVTKHDKEIKEIRSIQTTKVAIENFQNYLSINNDFKNKYIESYYFSGSIHAAGSWKELLIGILDNINTSHKKDFERILGVTGGHGRKYFSQTKEEINKYNPLEIKDTGIYVATKLGANNIVRLCSDIIYEFGYSEDDFKIYVRQNDIMTSENINAEADKEIIVGLNHVKADIELRPITKDINLKPVVENIKSKPKKERYIEYKKAVQKIIPDIKMNIRTAGDEGVKFKISDIVSYLGEDFKDLNPTSIYWGLKYVLFKEGIVVGTEAWKSEEKILTMRNATPTDVLPPSLADDNDDVEGVGEEKPSKENIEKESKENKKDKKGGFLKKFFGI